MDTTVHYAQLYSSNEIGSMDFSIWQTRTYDDLMEENLEAKIIMEVGVWPHGILYTLKKNFPNNTYIGVDLSDQVLEYLEKNGYQYHRTDIGIESIDIPDQTVDIIVFNEVIEHIFDCQHAVNELYRVLKQWGRLYISTHNTFNIAMRIKYLFGMIPNGSLDVTDTNSHGEHIRIFNHSIFLTLLQRAGFTHFSNRSWTGIFGKFFVTRYLTALLARHFYYICTK